MKNKDITLHYSFVQATFWMGFSATSAFASVYLLDIGISNAAIGLVISLGALFSALTQPVIGNLVDNNPKLTLKLVLNIAAICAVIISALLYPVSRLSSSILAVLYGILILIIQFGQPFTNALGMAGQNSGYKLLFGPARAIGSLGYALVAYILGIVTVSVSPQIVPLFIAVIFVLHLLSIIIFPLKEKDHSTNITTSTDSAVATEYETTSPSKTTIFGFLAKYKAFSIMLLGLVFIYFSHVILNSYSLQIIIPRGGSSANMGTATAISAGIELVPMFLFPLLRKKFKVNHLLRLSVIFFTLKVLLTYLATNVLEYYAAQLCQMIGWGIMAVAIVYFVKDNIDEHDQAQGQAFAGMALTIGNVIGGFVGGFVIDIAGIDSLLLTGLTVAIIGTIIFWIGIGKSEKPAK